MLAIAPPRWPYLLRAFYAQICFRVLSMEAQTAAPAFFAIFLVSSLLVRNFASGWIFIGWSGLFIGFMLSSPSCGNRRVFWGLIGLLLSHALAIPGSIIWGSGNWELTAGVVMWMAPAVLLYAGANARVFPWLTPALLVHAALIFWQGMTNWGMVGGFMVQYGNPTGLANNRNLAAGFLSIGIIYLVTTRARPLVPILLIAMLFTGSRWGLMVTCGVLVAMAIAGSISWKMIAAAVLSAVLGVVVIGVLFPDGYKVAGFDGFANAASTANADIGARLAIPHLPSILPSGVAEHPGLHNVPLRMSVESGLIAAAMWIGITVWALVRRPLSPTWWLLLTLVLLSMLDYYTWMGHLGGFWWLLVGLQHRPEKVDQGVHNMVNDHHRAQDTEDGDKQDQPEPDQGPSEPRELVLAGSHRADSST